MLCHSSFVARWTKRRFALLFVGIGFALLLVAVGRLSTASRLCASLVSVQYPAQTTLNGFPKLIHQAWDSGDVPDRFTAFIDGCKTVHEGWDYKLWNATSNRELVATEYPWFLWNYDRFGSDIQRLDAARVFYLHKYGGVYMDVDFTCIKSLEPLLNTTLAGAVLGQMDADMTWRHSIPNAFMASRPGHPFWMHYAHQMIRLSRTSPSEKEPEAVTGPIMLTKLVARWMSERNGDDLEVLPPGIIYPINWRNRTAAGPECHAKDAEFNEEKCKNRFPDSYTITYFTHSWST